MTQSTPVFIVGAQRSGTTLLRLLLNAHSALAIPEEGTFWMPLLRRFGRRGERELRGRNLERALAYIERNHQFKLWNTDPAPHFDALRRAGRAQLDELIAGTYMVHARAQGKHLWGEKSSVFFRTVPLLADLFPGARFIHLIRDGRDVFASWRTMDPTKGNAAVAAVEWAYKLRKARRDLARLGPERSLELRYEALAGDPETTLRTACRFLDLEFEPRMLDFWQSSREHIGAHHSQMIFNPVSTRSVSRWQKDLTPRQVRNFELLAGRELRALGYDVARPEREWRAFLLGALPELAIGLPLRAGQVIATAIDLDLSSRFGRATRAAGGGDAPEPAAIQAQARAARSPAHTSSPS
jgi:Sulfotransferase family